MFNALTDHLIAFFIFDDLVARMNPFGGFFYANVGEGVVVIILLVSCPKRKALVLVVRVLRECN
jgi:hypothetical protein